MILEQAERDRVQQLLCETLPAICQASLSGFADIKVDALIGITLNKSDVFLVSIKETCHPDGAVDIDEGKGGRPSKVNKIIAKTEVSTKRTSGRGRRKKAKRAASESEEEYIPSKKASQRGENDELDTSTTAAEQSEGSPRKRSRAQRKSAVKAEASFQEQEPDDDEAPELPPHGTAEFSDDDFVGDDTGDYSDMDNDDETEMTDIRQQIDNQQASLDKMMIKQEPDSTDRTSTADGDGDFLDRPFTASKASDDQMENTDEQDTSSNKQVKLWKIEECNTEGNLDLYPVDGESEYHCVEDSFEGRKKSKRGKKRGIKKRKGPYKKDEEGNYICPVCPFKTKYPGNYNRHRHTHGAKVECDVCQAKFSDNYALKKHRAGHFGTIDCDLCDKKFKSESGLGKHKRLVHLKKAKYSCVMCDKTFNERKHFEGHMNTHTGNLAHVCRYCGKKFAFENSWSRHEKGCGIKQGQKKSEENLICNHCGLKFLTSQNLKDHVRGAHEGRVVRCRCGKAFIWRGSYYKHKRTCTYGRSFVVEEQVHVIKKRDPPVKEATKIEDPLAAMSSQELLPTEQSFDLITL